MLLISSLEKSFEGGGRECRRESESEGGGDQERGSPSITIIVGNLITRWYIEDYEDNKYTMTELADREGEMGERAG